MHLCLLCKSSWNVCFRKFDAHSLASFWNISAVLLVVELGRTRRLSISWWNPCQISCKASMSKSCSYSSSVKPYETWSLEWHFCCTWKEYFETKYARCNVFFKLHASCWTKLECHRDWLFLRLFTFYKVLYHCFIFVINVITLT